jgi:hypothetical protein
VVRSSPSAEIALFTDDYLTVLLDGKYPFNEASDQFWIDDEVRMALG